MNEIVQVEKFLGNPQGLVAEMEKRGSIDLGLDYIRLAYEIANNLDGTFDTVLPAMEDMYERNGNGKEYNGWSFYEMMTRLTPLSRETILRHTKFGRVLEKVPEEIRPRLEALDRKSKTRLTKVIDEYELTPEQLDKMAMVNNLQQAGEFAREVTGEEPRSQFVQFMYDRDNVIFAKTAFGTFVYCEPVKYENPEIQAAMDRAHQRAINRLGATPK